MGQNMKYVNFPPKQGLYDPAYEHDSCGVGFVVHVKGVKSHGIIKKGIEVLNNLSHRGAQGADPKTGDGAGVMIQLPHGFFKSELESRDILLPDTGSYAVGMIFLPRSQEGKRFCMQVVEKSAEKENIKILAWRDVPVDSSRIGRTAAEASPVIKQVFILKPDSLNNENHFEAKLYVLRRSIEKKIISSGLPDSKSFYISSFSSRTIVYKGLLMSEQLENFYQDLKDERLTSAIALVHSRYSTNTFPTWNLSQPFRYLAHNGEINTLRGNINWMSARQASLKSEVFGKDIEKLFPIIVPGGSDSASLDNVLEFLLISGRPLEHVMMMLMPEAWENDSLIHADKKSFYEYHSALM